MGKVIGGELYISSLLLAINPFCLPARFRSSLLSCSPVHLYVCLCVHSVCVSMCSFSACVRVFIQCVCRLRWQFQAFDIPHHFTVAAGR